MGWLRGPREIRRLKAHYERLRDDYQEALDNYQAALDDLDTWDPRIRDILEALQRDAVIYMEDGRIVIADRPKKTIAREWLEE